MSGKGNRFDDYPRNLVCSIAYLTWAVTLLVLFTSGYYEAFATPQLLPLEKKARDNRKEELIVSQKADPVRIPLSRKPPKRRYLMARFSPKGIFVNGLPTPEKPLNPKGLDLAQTLKSSRAPKSLELYSKLLYGGVRQSRLDGKRFEAEGEVFRGTGVPEGHFLLFRWFFDCCSLDAQPFGIIVRSDELIKAQAPAWVHVAGTMKFRLDGGKKIAYLEAETVQRIPTPPPEERYITY